MANSVVFSITGGGLLVNQAIRSSNGKYQFRLGADGKLLLTECLTGRMLGNFGYARGARELSVAMPYGSLQLLLRGPGIASKPITPPLWRYPNRLVLQDDSRLVLCDWTGQVIWQLGVAFD